MRFYLFPLPFASKDFDVSKGLSRAFSVFLCSLSRPGLYLSDFRELQDCTGSVYEERQLFC